MVDKPCQGGHGLGEVTGTNEDEATVSRIIAYSIHIAMNKCDSRRRRRYPRG
jgi:hypothetical protein